MKQFIASRIKKPPLQLHLTGLLTLKSGFEIIEQDPRFDRFAAGKDIHRRITIFWPCVDGDMGFGDDDHAAYAVRAEGMEGMGYDGGFAFDAGLNHRFFDVFLVLEQLRDAVIKLNEYLSA